MGYIVDKYKEGFLQRFDRDEAFPELDRADFPGLFCEEGAFRNASGVEIRYNMYSYEGYDRDKLLLFCHGLGSGHVWYGVEIESLCRAGYRVLAFDYTGCGKSGGEKLPSANAPVKDALELLALLKPREEVIPIGHSLGGYTALCLANLLPEVRRAVILSGFLSISDEMMGFVKLRILADRVKSFEKKLDPRLGSLDNRAYLASTTDKLLWIHAKDDPVVNYRYNAGRARKLGNPNLRVVTVERETHFPQFTTESVENMNRWLGEYLKLVGDKQLQSPEEKKGFFADKPLTRMTELDPAVTAEVLQFLQG